MTTKRRRYMCITIAPILILGLITIFSFSKIPERIYVNESIKVDSISLPRVELVNKLDYVKDSIEVRFLGLIPVKSIPVTRVNDLEVYPGGTSIGIKLSTEGVLVVGFSEIETENGTVESPAGNSGLKLGDLLISINNQKIESSKDLSKKLKAVDEPFVNIEYIRDNEKNSLSLELLKEEDDYKLGLWVRDSTSGIGTLTFYHNETNKFGALGHSITDGDTNKMFTIKDGELVSSSIINVKKGEKGNPGELRGIFTDKNSNIGRIEKNTHAGIFGESSEQLINPIFNKPIKVGFRNEIKEGPATILTTVDEEGPKEYEIEIVNLLPQDVSGPKSMVIKVTDEELLEKTGGIVQGMSGSPIIQDGKIVGAVTHVLINKPEVGYGIYIEWMLQDAGIID